MNYGFKNENDFVEMINGKSMSQIPLFLQKEFKTIFKCNDDDKLCCKKYGGHFKPDVIIEKDNLNIKVSIKSGNNVSVHEETLLCFLDFLKSIGISSRTLKIIKFYHYGRVEANSITSSLLPLETIKTRYAAYIKQANLELNSPKNYMKIIERILFMGKYDQTHCFDYLYYGMDNYGLLISKEKIEKYLLSQKSMYLSSIHIGPFIYQPASRTNYKIKYCQFKWKSLLSDVINISKQN